VIKRAFDILASLLGIVVLSPVLLLVASAVKLTSDAPVFYRGVRVGLNGKTFRIFKFSTMVANAESIGGPSTALNDARLTRIGKFLRRYKLDELPQLFNVLSGEMSVVGPRPQVERYTKLYDREQQVILTVRPGLTDYASVHFINLDEILGDVNVDEKYQREIEPEKNRLRIQYVKDQSFLTDMKIIALTLLRMLHIGRSWNTKP
jgi:lipopolysaccharide/colanic/teichoic acid biosynthesis glycosyltransferase